jgi:hypothetical protein
MPNINFGFSDFKVVGFSTLVFDNVACGLDELYSG